MKAIAALSMQTLPESEPQVKSAGVFVLRDERRDLRALRLEELAGYRMGEEWVRLAAEIRKRW